MSNLEVYYLIQEAHLGLSNWQQMDTNKLFTKKLI